MHRSTLGTTARIILWGAIGIATVFIVVFAVWLGPVVLTRYSGAGITAVRRLQLMNDVRTTLLGALGGSVALAGLAYTGRTYRLSRVGQITDRYTRAVDQLASSNVDVRTAAIYALERIMSDSHLDQRAIIELLASFVRGHAKGDDLSRNRPDGQRPPESDPAFEKFYHQLFDIPYLVVRAYDVQAAITVLGRTRKPVGTEMIMLGSTNLIRGYLCGVGFADVNLSEAHLEIANLSGADLRRAFLFGTRLVGAYLNRADFRRADLSGADLRYTDVDGADLRNAALFGSDFRNANLHCAKLSGALADASTRWPTNFDPVNAGVQMVVHSDSGLASGPPTAIQR